MNFYKSLLLALPNLPHESVPAGHDESGNIEVKKWSLAGVNTGLLAIIFDEKRYSHFSHSDRFEFPLEAKL